MNTTQLGRLLNVDDPLQHIARFMTVGALSTALDLAAFAALHAWLGLPALPANTLSYSLGTITNYILHRRWTYAGRPAKPAGVQALQFIAVSLAALALNTALVLLLSAALAPFTPAVYASLLAKLCATGVGLAWNFLLNHFWTFRFEGE
jgi:putative flippase GtrA